jgi:hypothetical protein
VEGFISSLNTAVTTAFGHELLELRRGPTVTTAGAVRTVVLVEQQPATKMIAKTPKAQDVQVLTLMLIAFHLRSPGRALSRWNAEHGE